MYVQDQQLIQQQKEDKFMVESAQLWKKKRDQQRDSLQEAYLENN